jgi:hypothetical protein
LRRRVAVDPDNEATVERDAGLRVMEKSEEGRRRRRRRLQVINEVINNTAEGTGGEGVRRADVACRTVVRVRSCGGRINPSAFIL